MSEFTIYSDPVDWLDKQYPIEGGKDLTDFIDNHADREIVIEIKKMMAEHADKIETKYPEIFETSGILFVLTQPCMAPIGETDDPHMEKISMEKELCCFLTFGYSDERLPILERTLIIGLALDPTTRRIIAARIGTIIDGAPKSVVLN